MCDVVFPPKDADMMGGPLILTYYFIILYHLLRYHPKMGLLYSTFSSW